MLFQPFFDYSLSYIDNPWVWSPVPDDVNPLKCVKMRMLEVKRQKIAPMISFTSYPVQMHS